MLGSAYPPKQKTITAMDIPTAQAVVSQELVEFEEEEYVVLEEPV